MPEDLHPEAERVLERRAEKSRLPYHTLSVGDARESFTSDMTSEAVPPSVGQVKDVGIGETDPPLELRIYLPAASGPHPVLVYFHGGGWVLGNLETHDWLCRELTRRVEAIVVAVDYRKAPEYPFPAAVEDAWRAVEWTAENASYLAGDPDRLAVAGDSVGATLATVVAMLARDRDGPSLVHQLLVHPVTDSAVDTASYDEYGSGYIGSRAGMEQYWEYYLRDDFDRANPYAAPLRARRLDGLAPARVLTCECDPLRDEGIAYAERLGSAGVLEDHTHETDVFHGYFVSVAFMDRAEAGVADLADGLRAAFADG